MGEDFHQCARAASDSPLCVSARKNLVAYAALAHWPREAHASLPVFPSEKKICVQNRGERKSDMERIRVFIADDHPVFRYGLRTLLQAEPIFEIVGEATTGLEAIDLVAARQPDVVLMDLTMP